MALEPMAGREEDDTELRDMRRRFWVSAVLSVAVVVVAMGPIPAASAASPANSALALGRNSCSPHRSVFWGGWPFFRKFWLSLKNRSPNMYTLIGLGVGLAYLYSVLAVVAPGLFPPIPRHGGAGRAYFEAAAVIVTLVLLGEVLELRAIGETSGDPASCWGCPRTGAASGPDGREGKSR